MGRLKCPCGEVLSDIDFPAKVKSWLLADHDLDTLDSIVGPKMSAHFSLRDQVNEAAREVWHCLDCGRLAVMRGSHTVWYVPEQVNRERTSTK